MSLVSRRGFLRSAGGLGFAVPALGTAYAAGIEPGLSLDITRYHLTPPHWPDGLSLRIAVIADIHACEPQMSQARVARICELTNRLDPDLIVVLGDFNAGQPFVTRAVTPPEWAEALSILHAPLGVFAVLGNHDLWHGALPTMPSDHGEAIRAALRRTRIELLENDAVPLLQGGQPFWLAGLADQLAHRIDYDVFRGNDDLDGTLAKVRGDAPIVLLAHEPMIFSRVPARVSLTLCGHTHGGQVVLPFIGSPFAERRFGRGHVYGHVVEDGRHMIISAGLGTSIVPVRFMRPPEIVEVTLGGLPLVVG